MPTMTFMQACRDFFGQKEGQTPIAFGKEVQQLSPEDKVQIAEGLTANGYTIVPMPGTGA